MDKSLDEIIGSSKPQRPAGGGVSKPQGNKRGRRGGGNRQATNQKGQRALYIKGLSDAISEDDLRDLFRQVGPVVRVEIQRNDAGNRNGTAWVLYDFPEDALVAQERFNQRKAAGRTITVKRVSRVGDTGSSAGSLEERIGEQVNKNSRRSRRSRAGSQKKAPPRTRDAADLDAELDAYMQIDNGHNDEAGSSAPAPEAAPEASAEPAEIDV